MLDEVPPGSPLLDVPGSSPEDPSPPIDVPVPADVVDVVAAVGSTAPDDEPLGESESTPSVSVDAAGEVSPHAVRRSGSKATGTGQAGRRIGYSDTAGASLSGYFQC